MNFYEDEKKIFSFENDNDNDNINEIEDIIKNDNKKKIILKLSLDKQWVYKWKNFNGL